MLKKGQSKKDGFSTEFCLLRCQLSGGISAYGGVPALRYLCQGAQVVGQHRPADPTFHALQTRIQRAVHPETAFKHADSPFGTVTPFPSSAEPSLALVFNPFFGIFAGPRKAHLFHSCLLGLPFIGAGIKSVVGRVISLT